MFDNILEKLKNGDTNFTEWSKEERKTLLNLYLIISSNEAQIFKFIYSYHECDCWEDIFRDYDEFFLSEKESGVNLALKNFEEFDKYMEKKSH